MRNWPTFLMRTLERLAEFLGAWRAYPNGTEGYRTAEVTLGGVATEEVSSKTFETQKFPGLYLVGEALDVTGWLGGYNFQWAWASGWCCGQHLRPHTPRRGPEPDPRGRVWQQSGSGPCSRRRLRESRTPWRSE